MNSIVLISILTILAILILVINIKHSKSNFRIIIKDVVIAIILAVLYLFYLCYLLINQTDILFIGNNQSLMISALLTTFIAAQVWHLISLFQMGDIWADTEIPNDDARLITNGLFSIVRHPIYLAFFIYGLTEMFSLYTIPIGLLHFSTPIMRLFIKNEEERLINKFGQEYIDYKNKVKWMLIPFIK